MATPTPPSDFSALPASAVVSDNTSLISQPSAPDPDAQIEADTGYSTDTESVADSAFSTGEDRFMPLRPCS